jgi:hypothetical protein
MIETTRRDFKAAAGTAIAAAAPGCSNESPQPQPTTAGATTGDPRDGSPVCARVQFEQHPERTRGRGGVRRSRQWQHSS